MNLVRWDPFRELEEMSDRLTRVFGRPTMRHESGKETMTVTDWLPAVDISETEREYLINIELPEVKKEDVKVTLQEGVLVNGERKQRKKRKVRNTTVSNHPMAVSRAVSRSQTGLMKRRSQLNSRMAC